MLISASSRSPQQFVNLFMAGLSAKLFISLGLIILFALGIKENIVCFMISAIIIYFSFTILEVVSLLKYLRKV